MLSDKHSELIKVVLSRELGEVSIESISALSGGCINDCYVILSPNGRSVIKINDSSAQDNFLKEKEGLQLLRSKSEFTVPQVYSYGIHGQYGYLLMEHIERGRADKEYWTEYGKKLYNLHQNHSQNGFGLDTDNYIGALVQKNAFCKSWVGFYSNFRLLPQIEMATEAGLLPLSVIRDFDRLITRLPDILNEGSPSLLHGDLWSGNTFPSASGNPAIFDPAVYYGHPETELAFTRLFGGFHPNMYSSYLELYQAESGMEERLEIYQLYPLLVHLNLFGSSYLSSIRTILARFC